MTQILNGCERATAVVPDELPNPIERATKATPSGDLTNGKILRAIVVECMNAQYSVHQTCLVMHRNTTLDVKNMCTLTHYAYNEQVKKAQKREYAKAARANKSAQNTQSKIDLPDYPVLIPRVLKGTLEPITKEFIMDLRKWLHMPDTAPMWVALGASVTADEDNGEPVWLQIVGPSSSMKTEITRMFADVRIEDMDDITEAGFLSWSKGKNPKPIGVLTRIRKGLITMGDFSTLLAGSDRGSRDKVYAALRRIYDGDFCRDIQAVTGEGIGGDKLAWQGRLTIISAVTNDIDRVLSFTQSLGERWLYVRIPDADPLAQRAAARMTRGRTEQMRADAAGAVKQIIGQARHRLPSVHLSERIFDAIDDAALVTAWGRAAVPRSSYGAREILEEAHVEGIGRLVRQLTCLARGLRALGLDEDEVCALCRRVALDSMPNKRRAVLTALAQANGPTSGRALAKLASMAETTARYVLEELEVIDGGLVVNDELPNGGVTLPENGAYTSGGAAKKWTLSPENGVLVRDVMLAPRHVAR